MSRRVALLLAVVIAVVSLTRIRYAEAAPVFGTVMQETLFASTQAAYGGQSLVQVNTATGALTVVGGHGAAVPGKISGMSPDQAGNQLFGGHGDSGFVVFPGGTRLVSVAPATGVATLIGDENIIGPGDNRLSDLARRPADGVVFFLGFDDVNAEYFGTINTATGAKTILGAAGNPPMAGTAGYGLEFNAAGVLFAADEINIYTLDPGTGAILTTTPLVFSATFPAFASTPRISSIAMRSDGVMFCTVSDNPNFVTFGPPAGPSYLATINAAGAVTFIATTTTPIDALCFLTIAVQVFLGDDDPDRNARLKGCYSDATADTQGPIALLAVATCLALLVAAGRRRPVRRSGNARLCLLFFGSAAAAVVFCLATLALLLGRSEPGLDRLAAQERGGRGTTVAHGATAAAPPTAIDSVRRSRVNSARAEEPCPLERLPDLPGSGSADAAPGGSDAGSRDSHAIIDGDAGDGSGDPAPDAGMPDSGGDGSGDGSGSDPNQPASGEASEAQNEPGVSAESGWLAYRASLRNYIDSRVDLSPTQEGAWDDVFAANSTQEAGRARKVHLWAVFAAFRSNLTAEQAAIYDTIIPRRE